MLVMKLKSKWISFNYPDSSEIDVANALVSLRKSGTTLNKARCKQHSAGVGDEEFDEEDSDWVDEDVDDDEADDDDEEITTAEMVHMLKQKLGWELSALARTILN